MCKLKITQHCVNTNDNKGFSVDLNTIALQFSSQCSEMYNWQYKWIVQRKSLLSVNEHDSQRNCFLLSS